MAVTLVASRAEGAKPGVAEPGRGEQTCELCLSTGAKKDLVHEKRAKRGPSFSRTVPLPSLSFSASLFFFSLFSPSRPRSSSPSLASSSNLFTDSDKRRFLHGGIVPIDPMTPDVRQSCSKRAFDGQVRKWRRMLHEWDPEGEGGAGAGEAGEGEAAAATTAAPGPAKAGAAAAATTPGGPLVSPGSKRDASLASRTPASAVHPRKQRARGGAGVGKGGEAENDGGSERAAGAGIFADAVLVSADEAAAF